MESTQAKKARGMMTKYIVKNRIRDIEELKSLIWKVISIKKTYLTIVNTYL